MRIVSYNIMNGGEGRADPLAEVIEAQQADLVALIEADDLVVLERITNRLKMDHIHAAGDRHAVALLSRWPIDLSINHAPLLSLGDSCLLEAAVATPGGGRVSIGIVDLAEDHPEIPRVLSAFTAAPQLLMGSLSSSSARAIVEAGYRDLHLIGQADATATFPTSAPAERRDFILGHGIDPASLKSAWVERDRLARYASDHFPIGAELTLK